MINQSVYPDNIQPFPSLALAGRFFIEKTFNEMEELSLTVTEAYSLEKERGVTIANQIGITVHMA